VAALFVPVLAFAIYRVMDKTMIGALASVTELGLFENAEKIINIPVAVITALGVVMLPRMAHILADPGSDYRRTIRESMNLALMLGASMGVGLVVVADDAAVVLFGPAFAGSGLIIRLLALTVVASAWSNVVRTQYLIPRGRDGVYIASTIGAAGLNLGLNLLLIEQSSQEPLANPPHDSCKITLTHPSHGIMGKLSLWQHIPAEGIYPLKAPK